LLWDEVRQCIGLDAEFYEGADSLLYPPHWLDASVRQAELLQSFRVATSIGVDPAEGGDSTVYTAIDEKGLIEQISKKTPNTAVITSDTIAFAFKHKVPDRMVFFDAGGGGKQHADRLRAQGFKVNSVAFGAAATPIRKPGRTPTEKRKLEDLARYAYKNRRAEMYGMTSIALDPDDEEPFAIPGCYYELRRQMSLMPKMFDEGGRLFLPPKDAPKSSNVITIKQLLGGSPDELDSLVLAVYGLNVGRRAQGGGVVF
jgi:hypothetical protein